MAIHRYGPTPSLSRGNKPTKLATQFYLFPILIMTHLTRSPESIKVLILDEELTWGEAYTGDTKPRFKRWKVLSLSELKQCLSTLR